MLIGFKAFKADDQSWRFSTAYASVEEIQKAFMIQEKARYALLGLITALNQDIPSVFSCLIPHDNRFGVQDLTEWIAELKADWITQRLPVVLFPSDFDAKALSFLESLSHKSNRSIGLEIEGWLIHAESMTMASQSIQWVIEGTG